MVSVLVSVDKPVQLPAHQPGVVITVPLQRMIEYLEINHLNVVKVESTLVLIVKREDKCSPSSSIS